MLTSVPPWLIILAIVGLLFVFWLIGMAPVIQRERARELFRLQHERLEVLFLTHVRLTGSPRGLIWQSCTFVGPALLARDRHSRQIIAFVPITIQFEAEPEGDMVELPAVGQPRHATAVFWFHRGQWETAGKTIFNHTPEQVMERFREQYAE